MIEFKNIVKRFEDKLVLDHVSHEMKSGMSNLIIGTSGSGKTVLQKCLVGLFEPDEGDIIYDVFEIYRYNSKKNILNS